MNRYRLSKNKVSHRWRVERQGYRSAIVVWEPVFESGFEDQARSEYARLIWNERVDAGWQVVEESQCEPS